MTTSLYTVFQRQYSGTFTANTTWQSCLAMLQITPRLTTEDTEARKGRTYTKIVQCVIFTVSTYFVLKF